MKINTFLGVFELHVGVFIMATSFMTCGIYSFFMNLFNWDQSVSKLTVMAVSFLILFMIWIWAYASYGVYINNIKSPKIVFSALCQWTVFLILWIAAFISSQNSIMKNYVCFNGNCPESIWLYNNTWNVFNNINIHNDYDYEVVGLNSLKTETNTNGGMENVRRTAMFSAGFPNTRLTNNKFNGPRQAASLHNMKYGDVDVNIIIVIFYVLYYLVLFIYGWIVLYSYHKELCPI